MSNLRCPVCGGARVSPATVVSLPQHMALCYARNPQGGVFSKGKVIVQPSAGRACIDCGYVMYFLMPDDLALLRTEAEAGTIHPLPQ